MFKCEPHFDKNPNFTLYATERDEQEWLDANYTLVMDTFTDQQLQLANFDGKPVRLKKKLTWEQYLEYGRSPDGLLQFLADFDGAPVNPDSQFDKEHAALIWQIITEGLGFTKENLNDLARTARSLYEDYRRGADERPTDFGRRIIPKRFLNKED